MRRLLITASLLASAVVPAVLAPQVAAAQDRCEQIHHDNQVAGTVIGAVGGALLGGVVAGNRGHKDSGALLGAVAGGFVGNRIGNAKDPCPDGYQRVDDASSDLHRREDAVAQRINAGVNSGQLDRRQAEGAFGRLNSIRAQENDMRNRNGGDLSDRDRGALFDQLSDLERSIGGDQSPPPPTYNDWRSAPAGLHDREAWIGQRIHDATTDGSLSRDDARRLDDQLRWIRDQEYWFAQDHGGLTPADEQNLQQQLYNLMQRFRHVTGR